MKRKNSVALVTLAGVIAVLLFYQTPLMGKARAATWDMVVRRTATLFKVGQIAIRPDVMEQLQRLRTENTRLQYEVEDYKRLRHQLGSPAYGNARLIQAAVIARPIDTFQTEYVISKGISDGIVLNAPVVLYDSMLIGFISDINERTATMRLLIHPKTSLTAEVIGAEKDAPPARGLLAGQGYTSLLLSTIPRDVRITSGQPVVTAAGNDLPAGLTVGQVGEVSNKENEPYQQAQVTLPYDVDAIEAVTVLVPP